MRKIEIVKVKKLTEDAILPTYAKEGDCCADLYANADIKWTPLEINISEDDEKTDYKRVGYKAIVPTGIAVALPIGYEWQVRPRSGNAAKYNISVLNTPGTCDEEYRGEVMVILVCIGEPIGPFANGIKKGMRVAQVKLSEVTVAKFEEVATLPTTDRGEGGLGSTGV